MSEPQKLPLIRLEITGSGERMKNKPSGRSLEPLDKELQVAKFTQTFADLQELLESQDRARIRSDPNGLAPERLIVFEVKESIENFYSAVARVQGLEWIGEIQESTDSKKSNFYILFPTYDACDKIVALWNTYKRNGKFDHGFASWRNLFDQLLNVRRWEAKDRIEDHSREILEQHLKDATFDQSIVLEIELFFNNRNEIWGMEPLTAALRKEIAEKNGEIIDEVRIGGIHYHALLVKIPRNEIERMLRLEDHSIVQNEAIYRIQPQSVMGEIDSEPDENDSEQSIPHLAVQNPSNRPMILAILDGVPVSGHRLLKNHLVVSDHFLLEKNSIVSSRVHGTAMASLIIHGDRHNEKSPVIDRKILLVPVMSQNEKNFSEKFLDDKLTIDVIYQAILSIVKRRETNDIYIISHSLGNRNACFRGQISHWARLLDWLSYEYGILFLVSAGNHPSLKLNDHSTPQPSLLNDDRVIPSILDQVSNRRLLSPAESINALTIGARNSNEHSTRQVFSGQIVPFSYDGMPNPSSALGLGYARSVKPDLLMPGGKEILQEKHSDKSLFQSKIPQIRGLKVAAPDPDGIRDDVENCSGWTSGATAMASRAAHRIHDSLAETYGEQFENLDNRCRAVLIKALLVHTAWWPVECADYIDKFLPTDLHSTKRKEQVSKFLGYGISHPEIALSCAQDRVTFWATGEIDKEAQVTVNVPIPECLQSYANIKIHATLAWFSPITTSHAIYRIVRLKLLNPNDFQIKTVSEQPDHNQVARGTVLSKFWTVKKLTPPVSHLLSFRIQREIDKNTTIDSKVPFGLAITVEAKNCNDLYIQARSMVQPMVRV